jgi:hypothetical protein
MSRLNQQWTTFRHCGISAPEQASGQASLLVRDQRYSRTRGLNP